MNQQELELLWAYQQEDMAADRIASEIRRSPTRQKLEKDRDFIMEQQKRFKQIEEQIAVLADRVDAIKDAIVRCEEQIKNVTARFEAEPPADLDAARSMIAEITKHRETISSYEQEMRRIVKDTNDYDSKQRNIRHEAAKTKQEFDQLKVVYDKELKEKKTALDAQRAVADSKKNRHSCLAAGGIQRGQEAHCAAHVPAGGRPMLRLQHVSALRGAAPHQERHRNRRVRDLRTDDYSVTCLCGAKL